MHLQEHASAGVVAERLPNADHCDLDEVGRGPLNRGVLRHSFAELAHVPRPGAQFGDIAAPSQQRLDVPRLPGLRDLFVQVAAHTREALEVLRDEPFRLVHRNAEPTRQPEGPLAVERGEVHRLGLVAHSSGDLVQGHVEDHGGGFPVDVVALAERAHEDLVAGEVRQYPEFDLGVVGRDQHGSFG